MELCFAGPFSGCLRRWSWRLWASGIPGWRCGDMNRRENSPLCALKYRWSGLSSQETQILAPVSSHSLCVIFVDLSFLLYKRVLLLIVNVYGVLTLCQDLCQSSSCDWSHFIYIPTWAVGRYYYSHLERRILRFRESKSVEQLVSVQTRTWTGPFDM